MNNINMENPRLRASLRISLGIFISMTLILVACQVITSGYLLVNGYFNAMSPMVSVITVLAFTVELIMLTIIVRLYRMTNPSRWGQ